MYSPASVPGMTVGLDVGDRFCDACFLDGEAQVIESSRIRTAPAALEYRFAQIAPVRVVLETGKHSPWISRLLECLGHEVIVANARRVKLISCNAQKSDTVDAEFLARLGRIDPQLLKPIQHRGEHAQLDLAIIRARDVLVRSRTQLVKSRPRRGEVRRWTDPQVLHGGLLSPCAPPCPRITPSRADASPGSARFPERADPQL